MRRTYELALVVDPRLSDEDAVGVVDQYKEMVLESGAEITKEESWGKRKLAYQINKLSEGSYMLFHVRSNEGDVFTEVEQRMRQNERVLRYMTVRTDAGRLRHRGAAETEEVEEVAETDSAETTEEESS